MNRSELKQHVTHLGISMAMAPAGEKKESLRREFKAAETEQNRRDDDDAESALSEHYRKNM